MIWGSRSPALPMPPLELDGRKTLWGVCLTRNQQGPASAPVGLLPSLWVQIPLPSTYLTSKGTSGSGTFAVSSREEVSPGLDTSKDDIYGCGSGL